MGDDITRGERGPTGDKGAHGQHGDVGLTGPMGEEGIEGAKGERGDTGRQGESTLLSRNVSISFLLLAVMATAVLGVMTFAIVQNRSLIGDLDDQQEQINQQRLQTRQLFERSDMQLCNEIETLKRQNREDAREVFQNLDRTLRLLGIEKTPEIVAVARENLVNDLRRNASREGGCAELPSNG